MGRKPWCAPAQLQMLSRNVERYEQAQQQNRVPAWLAAFTEAFFDRFPVGDVPGRELLIATIKRVR